LVYADYKVSKMLTLPKSKIYPRR